jgi:hypothetical protein
MALADREYAQAPGLQRQRSILRFRPLAYVWAGASPLILLSGDSVVGVCGLVLRP